MTLLSDPSTGQFLGWGWGVGGQEQASMWAGWMPQRGLEKGVAQSCPILRDPMDCSSPGSSVLGILQAGVGCV